MLRALLLPVIVLVAPACAAGSDCLDGQPCANGGRPVASRDGADAGGPAATPAPACTTRGRPHVGLGGTDLAARTEVPRARDRIRAKPYPALAADYARFLGEENRPRGLERAASTFGVPAERWFFEPLPTAAFVGTAYEVAFDGCLRATGATPGGKADPRCAAPPTDASARALCAEWTRRAFRRAGSPDEIAACAKVAIGTTTETYAGASRPVTPERRWAYACASVLSATGFLTY